MPLALSLAKGREGVDRLAALADDEDEGVLVEGRIAIAELARDLHLRGDAGEMLDEVFADHGRVRGRPATAEDDALDIAQFAGGEAETAEHGGGLVVVEAPAEGVLDRSRLLEDLLEHVMGELPFLRLLGGEVDLAHLVGGLVPVDVLHREIVLGERHEVPVRR